jgi:hypothetical protein
VNENFSRVSPILRLRPFLRNCLTTSIPQLVFHVGKICICYLFFLVSCQGFCARLCSRCIASTIGFSAVLFLWCCEGYFFVCWGLWRARADVAMEAVDSIVAPIKEFAKDSGRLVNRCHKPDRKGMFRWTDPQPWTQRPSWSHMHFTSVLLCNRLYNADQTLRRLVSELRWSPEA